MTIEPTGNISYDEWRPLTAASETFTETLQGPCNKDENRVKLNRMLDVDRCDVWLHVDANDLK